MLSLKTSGKVKGMFWSTVWEPCRYVPCSFKQLSSRL